MPEHGKDIKSISEQKRLQDLNAQKHVGQAPAGLKLSYYFKFVFCFYMRLPWGCFLLLDKKGLDIIMLDVIQISEETKMLLKLFLCFTLIPVIELYLLIKVGTIIGGFNTILLVILTGFLGAWLARIEGMNTMMKLKMNLQQGLMPAEELIDAVIIFGAGLVLITPGLITDVCGLLLLWPLTRNKFKQFLRKKFDEMQLKGNINITRFH